MVRKVKDEAEKTRESLIEVAKKMFSEKGYSDTSISEICDRLNISKGALFHYFPTKRALFLEIWTRLQIEMDEAARVAAIKARDPENPYGAFLAGCKVYLIYAARRDYQNIVLVDGPSVLGMKEWYQNDHELGSENVLAGVRYLAKQGIVKTKHVPAIAVMLQSALNGVGFALSRNVEGVDQDTALDAFESMIKSLR